MDAFEWKWLKHILNSAGLSWGKLKMCFRQKILNIDISWEEKSRPDEI